MPVFAYKGLDVRGKNVNGLKDADTPKALRAALRREGIFVVDVAEARAKAKGAGGTALSKDVDLKQLFDRISRKDVALVTAQLATLLKAGIPLAEAIGALVEQVASHKLRTVLAEVRTKVNEGTSLADALSAHPRAFDDLYVSMVRAGEAAGNLDSVLARLAQFMEAGQKLRTKVTSAMIYPIIMLVVSTVLISFIMVGIVPKITEIFEDQQAALPWNTQLLIFGSHLIGTYWYLLLALVGVGIWGFRRWHAGENGRRTWDALVLKIPFVGDLARKVALSRFTRTLGTMLSAGVPLLRAMEISRFVLGNVVLQRVVDEARDAIREGESVAAPLKRSGHFPPMVTHMIAVGERSGQLEQMLETVGQNYETEVDVALTRFTSMLEPLMIVVMGGAVGFIVFSMLQPVMQMNDFIK